MVEFDPKQISYDRLLDAFWTSHSPEYQRKGQYRSAVFTYGSAQAELATQSMARLEKKLGRSLSTHIEPAQTFWRAEEYHQQYFEKSGAESCPIN